MTKASLLAVVLLLGPAIVAPVAGAQGAPGAQQRVFTEPVQSKALAVAITENGSMVGASADISLTVATEGSGHVFIDTRPLAGTDMQGSARMAAQVAASVTGYSMEAHDFFFTVRSDTPLISGPSAGAVMANAAVVGLMNANLDEGEDPWELDPSVMSTGTIAPDGSIGPVGGILQKAEEARDEGAGLFTVPAGQERIRPGEMVPGMDTQQPVHVPTYCEEELGIECREVGNLEELVELTTGYRFDRPDLGQAPTTAEYNATLAPLSLDLLEDATVYQDVWEQLNGTDLSQQGEQVVQASLEQAHASYQEGVQFRQDARYYSSASRAFAASIHGTHAGFLLTYFETGRSLDYVEDRLGTVEERVDRARENATGVPVEDMHALYTVGAAQERVSDAENHVDSARQLLDERNVPEALFDMAWASERAKTVHWWLHLGEEFGEGPGLPVEIDRLSADFIDLADEMIVYASQVLDSSPPRASETVQDARADDRRGFHAAALTQAAQAQVQAAITVELRTGEPSPEKVNTSQRKAMESIHNARGLGVEPVLAVAMFEFGADQDEATLQLEHYRTAQVLAGISNVLAGEGEQRPSTFTGSWEPSEDARFPVSGGDRDAQAWAVGWFLIGMFTTVAVGAFAAGFLRRGEA